MGLIHNLLMSVIHLIFVGTDILMTMILLKVTYDRWQPECLKLMSRAVKPVISFITGYLEVWTAKMTGKTYPEKTQLVLLVICLSVIRFIIATLL